MSLKQVIIINKENTLTPAEQAKCLAKASTSLMTRCFDGADGFIGRHENKAFHKIVIDWIDNHDQNIDLYSVDKSALSDVYYWTAEMEGIPSKHIYFNNQLACTVLGPGPSDDFDAFLLDLTPYTG